MITIYHNNRCSKSRQACNIIAEKGLDAEIIQYLKTPPSAKLIGELLQQLDLPVESIIRKGEKLFKEKYKTLNLTTEEWIQVLAENPILIERPIVVNGNKAVIARPPEKVLELLS